MSESAGFIVNGPRPPEPPTSAPLLHVKNLHTVFQSHGKPMHAVTGVSLQVRPGETLGVVGESGSGKSVTALSIMRLVRAPAGRISEGEVWFDGRDLLKISDSEMRAVRGRDIAMIFQDPMSSLNPVFTIADQICEAIRLHNDVGAREAMDRTIEVLRLVHFPAPEQRAHAYPHMLSGGLRQRAMIAMGLACNPKLLIADEPTTALDVTIQAQIIELLNELKERLNMAMILITHDMGVIAETAQRVAVMYAGQIVEEASVEALFDDPLHPYTQGLLRSIPAVAEAKGKLRRLPQIPGTVPRLYGDIPNGCRFAPRCGFAKPEHFEHNPALVDVQSGRRVACFQYQ